MVGEPSQEQQHLHGQVRAIVKGFNEEVLRPGITCEQAMKEALQIYDRVGVEAKQYVEYAQKPYMHLCHGLGMNASEPPLVRITDQTVIRAGMVFSVEAYVGGGDITYGSEEDVLVTESGCQVLSDPDPGLYVIAE